MCLQPTQTEVIKSWIYRKEGHDLRSSQRGKFMVKEIKLEQREILQINSTG